MIARFIFNDMFIMCMFYWATATNILYYIYMQKFMCRIFYWETKLSHYSWLTENSNYYQIKNKITVSVGDYADKA